MKIRLYDQPFVVAAPQVFLVDNLGEWLLSYYGEVPSVRIQIFEGEPSAETEITGDLKRLVNSECEEFTVLESPGDVATALAVLKVIYYAYVAYTIISALTQGKPEQPSNVNRTQQSPNNSLGSRENQVRYLQRVEDIYGTVKSIPSLMMPAYLKYKNNRKFEYGYYCVGRGYYSLADIKDGDTLVSSTTGSSASVYDPFTSPNSGSPTTVIGDAITDDIVTARRSIEIDGITLKALNQLQLPTTEIYTFTPTVDGDFLTQKNKTPNFSSCASVGDKLVITNASAAPVVNSATACTVLASDDSFNVTSGNLFQGVSAGMSVTVAGFVSNNGTFTVVSSTATKMVVSAALTDETFTPTEGVPSVTVSFTVNYNGTYTIYSVGDANVSFVPSVWTNVVTDLSCSVQLQTLQDLGAGPVYAAPTEWTNWVTLPTTTRDRVWSNITASAGLYKDKGEGKLSVSVNFDLQIEQLNATTLLPTGVVETISSVLSGSVSDERALTLERTTAWTGAARTRMRRTTLYDYAFQGTIVDEIKWVDLYSVSPAAKLEFGNKTTIHTVTEATPRATAVKARQLNCIASRKLPTYNGSVFSGVLDSEGRLVSGSLSATSKMVDILAAVSADPLIGRRNLSTDVDINQIYSVQQQLDAWSSEAGIFNYTFDSDNISFEEVIIAVANAAFCIAYRQNGKIRVAFDKLQNSSTALFTHRNKKPKAESITRTFANDADYDGVQFVYSDPETLQSETITLPLDGSAIKPKKYEITGIRSFTQAWYRANREYQKMIGQRVHIETETAMDARSLLPNSRVDIVDNTRFMSYDGEVVAQSGFELTLSQPVEFLPSTPHSIVLMKRDGGLQSIPVTAGSSNKKVVLQSLPSEAIKTTNDQDGIRTIFSFAADSARGSMAYLVQEIDLSDAQYVKIKAINYSADYYQHDVLAVPAKSPIINGDIILPNGNVYLLWQDGGILMAETSDSIIQE